MLCRLRCMLVSTQCPWAVVSGIMYNNTIVLQVQHPVRTKARWYPNNVCERFQSFMCLRQRYWRGQPPTSSDCTRLLTILRTVIFSILQCKNIRLFHACSSGYTLSKLKDSGAMVLISFKHSPLPHSAVTTHHFKSCGMRYIHFQSHHRKD